MLKAAWFALVLGACGTSSSTTAPTATARDFTNAKGELVCPVMGDVVASKEAAMGSAVHEGKTYWFCCDSCSHTFAADPVRYADGKFLAHLQTEHGGSFGACSHPM